MNLKKQVNPLAQMRQGPSEAKTVKIWGRDKGQITFLFPYTVGEDLSLRLQPCLLAKPYYHHHFSPSEHSVQRRWLDSRGAWVNWGASPMTYRSSHLALGLGEHSGAVMFYVYSQFWLFVECSSVNKGPNPWTDFFLCQGCCGLAKWDPGILLKANNMKCFMTSLWHSLKKPFFCFRYLHRVETLQCGHHFI